MIDSGDTAWILVSTALVMLMTPGVGLFYGGMVRRKNAVALITLAFISLIIVGIQWVVVGYSLSFGQDVGGFIGNLNYFCLNNVGFEAFEGTKIPHLAFMLYQMMFAVVTLAILVSAVAERSKAGRIHRIWLALGFPRIQPLRSLVLGRWMASKAWSSGFRWRNGCACQLWILSLSPSDGDG